MSTSSSMDDPNESDAVAPSEIIPSLGIDEYVGSGVEVVRPLPVESHSAEAWTDISAAPRRRLARPVLLFLLTCVTTFCAGCYHWSPTLIGDVDIYGRPFEYLLYHNWGDGLIFMVCVMSVLMLHEMGHFLMTLKHKVHASYPYFIPMPMMLIGTMGAVIGMDRDRKADRKTLFDIGIAGPLAGLVLIVPLVVIGIMTSKVGVDSGLHFGDPLLVKLLIPVLQPDVPKGMELLVNRNPIFMAGWVGMFVTGLNMLPMSQLDGGHVSHALFGKYSAWIARGVLLSAIGFMVITDYYQWLVMVMLIILMGPDHPPTADDTVDIGWPRKALGFVSLFIPVFCFNPFILY